MGALDGRVMIVTGVSRSAGIGTAIARRLAADGARLFLTGWSPHDDEQPWGADPGAAEGLRDELRHAGTDVEHLAVDLADPDAPAAVLAAARAAFGGPVAALVANHARSSARSLLELTADELDRTFAVNARATLLLTRFFAEQHTGAGGRVVLFTSGQYHGAMPGELPYVASKAVLQQLTATLAVALAPRGITVNCVNPGPNDTGYASGEAHRRVADAVPGGRWGHPDDAARLVAWLCSDEAAWVTGQTIASDGGWAARGSS